MAVNYLTALKSTRMQGVISTIDADANPATLEICTAAYATVLVSITLADPSFTESGGVITLASPPRTGVAAATGTAAVARIKDGAGNVIVNNLAVGVATGEIRLNSLAIVSGQTISITSGTLTHAA